MLVKEHHLGKRFEKYLSTGKLGWEKSETCYNILIKASDDSCKNASAFHLGLRIVKVHFDSWNWNFSNE